MKYEPAYDGLRALAVTSAVVFHAQESFCPGGWAGVEIFFVLSGYLITRILTEEQQNSGTLNLRYFYIRRVLRLLPAFACLIMALLPIALFSQHKSQHMADIGVSMMYLMNWNRAFGWIGGGRGMNGLGWLLGHTWSLSMEEQFYLLWPFMLIFLSRHRKAAPYLLLALIICVISWRSYLALHGAFRERTYNGFDTHSDAILLGCFLALLPSGSAGLPALAKRSVLFPLAMFGLILSEFHLDSILTQSIGLSLAAICAAWVLLAVSVPGFLQKLLTVSPLTYTGRISYGWYLWSYPLIEIGKTKFPQEFLLKGAIIIPVIASYVIATLSYYFVERPCLRIKHRYAHQ